MPTVADFLEHMSGGAVEDMAEVEAGKVLAAIGEHGSYASVVFDDPVTQAVIVRAYGGWVKLCAECGAQESEKWFRKDFAKTWAAYSRQGIRQNGCLAHYASLRKTWANVPLDRQRQNTNPGPGSRKPPAKYRRKEHEYHHSPGQGNQTGACQAQARQSHSGRHTQPHRERGGVRPGSVERMKKRGFDAQEIAEKLHEKGIDVKPSTLAKYLNEFRRGKDRKRDTPPAPEKTAPAPTPTPKPDRSATVASEEFTITPDTPLDEL